MKRISTTIAAAGLAAAMLAMAPLTTTAEAMPVASPPAQLAGTPLSRVQYYGYPYRRYYRGYRYYPRYRGPAGVYRCGPYALKTHLSRKYCR